MFICNCSCTCISVHVHICICMCRCLCMCVCIRICTCVSICVCIRASIHIHLDNYVYTYIRVFIDMQYNFLGLRSICIHGPGIATCHGHDSSTSYNVPAMMRLHSGQGDEKHFYCNGSEWLKEGYSCVRGPLFYEHHLPDEAARLPPIRQADGTSPRQ